MTPEQEAAIAAAKARLAPGGFSDAQRKAIAAAKARAGKGPDGLLPGSAEAAAEADAKALAMMQDAGYGKPQSPGVVADAAMSLGAGTLRGVAGAADLVQSVSPLSMAGQLADYGGRALSAIGAVSPETAAAMNPLPNMQGSARNALAAATGGYSEYQPQTTAGEYARTVGEFLPGAVVGPGGLARNVLTSAVIPGMASEAAGQLTEGTAAEPWARAGAAILSQLAANRAGKFAGETESAKMANQLSEGGVRGITAGQASHSTPIMRAEGRLAPTAGQLDDYTAAVMARIGSPAKLATPDTIREAGDAIVKRMDDAVSGLTVSPSTTLAQDAYSVAANYKDRVPVGSLNPRIRGIGDEIIDAATGGQPVPLSQLREWRSDIGKLTVSEDGATREAAHAMRSVIDNITDDALRAAGREADIAALAKAREDYRNFIAVRAASSRTETGVLSPTALNQDMIRAMGRENYATGRGTPMADFTRAGAAILRPAPTVMAGGERAVAGLGGVMGGVVGSTLGAGPTGAIIGALAGAAAPIIGRAAVRSGAVQSVLRDPASVAGNVARLAPGMYNALRGDQQSNALRER